MMKVKPIKIKIKEPIPSTADRLYAKHQAIRKAKGLPDASEYKKKLDSMKSEEIEQLDELSPETKSSYVSKAKDQIKQSMPFTKKSDEYRDIAKNFIEKRKRGIAKANEEVEQLDEIGDTPAGRKALGNYINRSHESGDAARIQATYDKDNFAKHTKTVAKRSSGIAKAVTRLTKESFRIGGMGGRGGGRGNIYMYDRNPGPRDDDDESGHVPYVPKTEHQKKLHKALTDLGNKLKRTDPRLKESASDDPKADQITTDNQKFPKKMSRKAKIVKGIAKGNPDQFQANPILDSDVNPQTNKQ